MKRIGSSVNEEFNRVGALGLSSDFFDFIFVKFCLVQFKPGCNFVICFNMVPILNKDICFKISTVFISHFEELTCKSIT